MSRQTGFIAYFDAGYGQTAVHDGAGDPVQRFRPLRQKGLRRKNALRRPGSVEQRGNLDEWFEIDVHGDASKRFRAFDGLIEPRGGLFVAEESKLAAMRRPETERRRSG